VWFYNPSTAPASWQLMMLTAEKLDFAEETATTRTARIEASEQGPDEYYLANE
jgi:hypothetical protein